MIFQKCIGPDTFSWLTNCVVEVYALPSALLVFIYKRHVTTEVTANEPEKHMLIDSFSQGVTDNPAKKGFYSQVG